MSGATGDATYTANRKAIVNGEGVYDHGRSVTVSQFNRFRARQSGYWSFLSGSIGYTFGAAGIWEWGLCGEPDGSLRWPACDQYFGGRSEVNYRTYSQAMAQPSSADMQYFSLLHRAIWDHSAADYLDVFEHGRIANQPQNDQHRKMVVARSSDWLFAYLPENQKIEVDVWGLTGDPAARLWFDPRNGTLITDGFWSCAVNHRCEFHNPSWGSGPEEEQDLLLVVPATTLFESFGGTGAVGECFGAAEPTEVGATPRIYAIAGRFSEVETWGVEALVVEADGQPRGSWFRVSDGIGGLPEQVAAGGSEAGFIVAWQADTDGDGLREIWARRLAASGMPSGPEFLVSSSDDVDHVTPAVAMSSSGETIIVWAAQSFDEEPRRILGQRLDAQGSLVGLPIEIGGYESVARFDPKVAVGDDGDFLVVWMETEKDPFAPALVAQSFDSSGSERTQPQAVATEIAPVVWLSGARSAEAGYRVFWENRALGRGTGWYRQPLDEMGRASTPPQQIADPFPCGATQ